MGKKVVTLGEIMLETVHSGQHSFRTVRFF